MGLPIGNDRDCFPNSEAKRASLQPGTIIDGRYEIEGFIGKGGMCSVYRAKHLALGRSIAVKMLRGQLTISSESMSRFKREAIAVGALDHPNIIKGYGLGIHDDSAYMAIEYIEGESLADRLLRVGKLDKGTFVRIMTGICSGLSYAHKQGIIHRDLKPSNIMILPGDETRIVDFGLAKLLPDTGREIQRLTQTGTVFGTVAYMSPEQCAGGQTDARSDVYSLGCMMYELLDGSVPFAGDSNFSVMYQHSAGEPKPTENLGEFAGIIKACLQKDPEERPQSVAEIAEAIHSPGSYKHAKQQQFKQGRIRRPSAIVIAAVASVLTAVSVFGMVSVLHNRPPKTVNVRLVMMKAAKLTLLNPQPLTTDQLAECEREVKLALRLPEGVTTSNQRQMLRAWLARILDLERDSAFEEAAADVKKHDDPLAEYNHEYALVLATIGERYERRANFKEALYWFIRQYHYVERTGNRDYLADKLFALKKEAEVYKRWGKLPELAKCYRYMIAFRPTDEKAQLGLAETMAAMRAQTPPER